MTYTATDPRNSIEKSPMTIMQIVIVTLTVLFSAVDGFDVLAISVSGAGIMHEFDLNRAGLGMVLSMELIGMAIGSILLGGIADKAGRRKMVLGCLIVMTTGMLAVSHASGIWMLCGWRIYTGLGIGGLLSSTNAIVAEFSNRKHRGLCISFMVIGYPLGGIVCGALGHLLLDAGAVNWRDMFSVGAFISAAMLPLTFFLLPESVHWLTRSLPNNALSRINITLSKIGHNKIRKLTIQDHVEFTHSVFDIFSPRLLVPTLLMTTAYLFQMITFYYILKWTPTIVVQMGIGAASAAGVLFWVNVGGVLGGITFGLLSSKVGIKPLTISILILTTAAVSLFGQSRPELSELSVLAALAGFFANAGVSGVYTLMALVFPTHVRATGTGFVIGMGRAGAIISPWLAGILMQQGLDNGHSLLDVLAYVALLMGLCSIVAACSLIFLRFKETSKTTDYNDSQTLTN